MEKKNTVVWLFKGIAIISLTACTIFSPPSTPFSTVTLPPAPLPTDTLLPTSTPSPGTIVKDQCFDIPSTPSSEVSLPGILVLSSPDGLSLLNFNQQNQREIPGSIHAVGTSPNREWLSYSYTTQDSENQIRTNLIVESADGQKQQQIPQNYQWAISGNTILWLDDQRLWFPVREMDKNATTLVLDPFTGEQQVLLPDFPNFVPYDSGPEHSSELYFGYSNAVYDSTLKLVIYPQLTEAGYPIVLWDQTTQKVLAKIPDEDLYKYLPLWLPDETGFVVVARPDWDHPKEWLLVSRTGEIRQLTSFDDLYPEFEIGEYASLSPNGQYLAFGLSQTKDGSDTYPKELHLLDLRTLETINTCILSHYTAPVWSPDSQYVAILSRNDSLQSAVILDIKQGRATTLSSGPKSIPVGWLKAP